MRALLLIPCLLLCACGDEPVQEVAPPVVYHIDTVALGDLLVAKRPDALAHVPEADREKVAALPVERLRALSVPIGKRYVVRLTLHGDHTWALTLREQAPSGAWANTDAKGTWTDVEGGIDLSVSEQSGTTGLSSPIHVTKTERGYELPARGRVFPLRHFEI